MLEICAVTNNCKTNPPSSLVDLEWLVAEILPTPPYGHPSEEGIFRYKPKNLMGNASLS